jgi:putative nucleotidyltransferase with HDIG domain
LRAKLVGAQGILEGEVRALDPSEDCVVGRNESAEIPLPDDRVSRKHCRFRFEDGFFVVEDLGSRNGTWVNGKRVSRAILFHADSVQIGSQEFRFELEEGSSVQTSRPVIESDEDSGSEGYATGIKERMGGDPASSIAELSRTQAKHSDPHELERGLDALCRVIDIVHTEERLDRLLRLLMGHVMHVTDADRGYLFCKKRPGGAITLQVSRYRDAAIRDGRRAFSRSIVTECHDTGYSILLAEPLEVEGSASPSIICQNIQSIMCVPMHSDQGTVGVIYVDKLDSSRKFTKFDLRVLSAMANQAGIAVRRSQLTRQVERIMADCILTLVNIIESNDEYTRSHSERVTEVALRMGKLLGLDPPLMRDLRLAGLLHDVGKIAVPGEVLRKSTSLTTSEYSSIREHAEHGAQVVASIENAEQTAAAVRHHHERWDGSGYPDGLAGENIPLLARILCIADAYDSMFAGRTYRKRMPLEGVLAEIKQNGGTQFDPNIVKTFADALDKDGSFAGKLTGAYTRLEDMGVTAEGPR